MFLYLFLFPLACQPKGQDTGLPAATSGTITALTYNVHGLPAAITGDDTPGRMLKIAPMLPDYPLVALQEDFDAENHEVLVAECDHATQHRFEQALSDRVYGSGLALLADWPEQAYQEQHYVGCNGVIDGASDCLASKGFQMVRLALGAASLDVYNTHHEAGGGDEDNAVREAQVGEVLAAMEAWSGGQAVLYLGDFNLAWDDPEDEPALALYTAAGFTDACLALDCPDPNRVDHAFFREGDDLGLWADGWAMEAGFVDEEGTPLSDHEALSFWFGWEVR